MGDRLFQQAALMRHEYFADIRYLIIIFVMM